MIAQVIKRYAKRRVIGGVRRVVTGAGEAVAARLGATQGGSEEAVINTAYIERYRPPSAPDLPRWFVARGRR